MVPREQHGSHTSIIVEMAAQTMGMHLAFRGNMDPINIYMTLNNSRTVYPNMASTPAWTTDICI